LAAAKFAVGLLSGSLVLVASAADSFADAMMSAVNLWGYRRARVPADADHPYGHGKLEGAFAVGQGMLLIGIVVSLVASCVAALWRGHPAPQVDLAVAALVASGLVAAWLTWLLRRAARSERSVVLEADAAHYGMDMLAAAGAVGGLLAVRATGWAWLDPAVSLLMAMLMARESGGVARRGLAELLDEALPADELERVQQVLADNEQRVVAFHGLRTRRGGPLRFVEVHAVLPTGVTLGDAHDLVQDIGTQIRAVLPASRVLVLPDAEGMADSVDDCLLPPA
jgi:cation diffusion facilitator family transporter